MTHKRKTPIRFRTGDKVMCLGAGRSGRGRPGSVSSSIQSGRFARRCRLYQRTTSTTPGQASEPMMLARNSSKPIGSRTFSCLCRTRHLEASRASPSRFRYPHPRDLDHASGRYHGLGLCSRQPGADQIDNLLNGETMGQHQRFGAAVRGMPRAIRVRGGRWLCGALSRDDSDHDPWNGVLKNFLPNHVRPT
jgi:hypothetical protein